MEYKCLSIAGFDGSGGAGLQADLKTFCALRCYGMTVLTAIPVQNTCGIRSYYDIPIACIKEQMESIFEDIRPDAIKIGMLFSSVIIELVASFLYTHAKNVPIILDPVMVSKSGHKLLQEEAIESLKTTLIPLATLITPNLPEALALIPQEENIKSHNKHFMAKNLLGLGCSAVILKGGHEKESETSDDIFLDDTGNSAILSMPRIASKNTHGTGCTLSAAIACFLAQRLGLLESCKAAKEYLFGAISASKDQSIGHGYGPVNHFYQLWNKGNVYTASKSL